MSKPTLRLILLSSLAILALFVGSDARLCAQSFTILPTEVTLSNTESRQLLIAQQTAGEKFGAQVTDAIFTSADDKIARVENGVVVPVANGKTTITAKRGDQTAAVEVTVTGQDQPFVWNFRNHVESVLSKQGCNGGACHGARAGQKGFRLSLFAYDVDADFNYLTRQAGGRRISLADPGRSLLLTKPTGVLPHKGGVRLEPDSREYRVLAEWIGAGTPGPREDDPRIVKLEVLPKYSVQAVGVTQQLVVQATFNDGRTEDVTRWSKFTITNASVASTDPYGKIKISGSGETAANVWYLNLTANAFVSVPYSQTLPPDAYANFEPRNFIDELALDKLRSLGIPPSPRCDDATFIRRVHLDCLGVLPDVETTRKFLADTSPDKRNRLIDELLTRPEFVDYWTYKWSDLFLLSGERLRPAALKAFNEFLRTSVAADKPWDRLAKEIVTASGSTHENGAAGFYLLHQDPEDVSETVAQAFLGLSINCAKCHNHPLEKWTNDQYYGMANMFSRVRGKGWGGDYRNGDGLRVVYTDTRSELLQPSRGKPQPPRPLDGPELAFDDPIDRRIPLADWLASVENPFFARSIANRVWANFFGIGLVEKVDDMRVSNPPSNEELLAACAKHLTDNGFQLKSLMRTILQSDIYQRSAAPTQWNKVDSLYYSRFYPRRLKAEVMLDAISQVTGVATEFKDQPKGSRALQLADSAVASYFLDSFGRPDRKITCDCERSDEPSMPQVLHLYNGDTLNQKLKSPDGRIAKLLAANASPGDIVDELYLSALSRMPRSEEKDRLVALLGESPEAERRQAVEDLYWSVLTGREFLFQH